MDPRYLWLGVGILVVVGLFAVLLYFGDSEPRDGNGWGDSGGGGGWEPGGHDHGGDAHH